MTAASAQSHITLEPWEPQNWPIAWLWIDAAWHWIGSDYHPRDLESFVEIKQRENADLFAVHADGLLCGLLIAIARSPIVCEAHCVFRPRSLNAFEIIHAINTGKRLAWGAGFHKITMKVFSDNRVMIGILKRMNAVHVGTEQNETLREGELVSMEIYSFLR